MPAPKVKLSSASFFDKYPQEYDQLTNARARLEPHRRELKSLIRDFNPALAVDAGCATGLTSMIFASEGITTVGFDREPKMIAVARRKYDHLGLPLKFMKGSFEAPPKSLRAKADLLVCLGNGISGLGTLPLLKKGLKAFYDCLRPGGTLVVQMLNFGAIPEDKLMPVRATRDEGIIYVRYARRIGRQFSLHVVRIDNTGIEPTFEPFCHDFDNFTATELTETAKKVGFTEITRFANTERMEKFTRNSRDLVLVARKPGKR